MKNINNYKNYLEDKNAKDEALSAFILLKGTGISVLDAARVIKNALDFKPKTRKLNSLQFCSKLIDSGAKNLNIKEMSVKDGFKKYLKTKVDLRPASLHDIKYISRRLFRVCPDLAKKNFSDISLSDCENYLSKTFKTAPQFNKGHRFLTGFFNYALRQEWTNKNIVKLVEKKKIIETEIKALSLEETKSLLRTTQLAKFRSCQAGVALLIWAGIRPQELTRLKWRDINLDENIVNIRPTTSKTGGSRHIEICASLKKYLQRFLKNNKSRLSNKPIVPPNWQVKWKALRSEAGFNTWTQDVLRHTYASYHTKYYKDLHRLQINMGHSDLNLLRSRYINMHDISKQEAKDFFNMY